MKWEGDEAQKLRKICRIELQVTGSRLWQRSRCWGKEF